MLLWILAAPNFGGWWSLHLTQEARDIWLTHHFSDLKILSILY
jgi:hypothetical protein